MSCHPVQAGRNLYAISLSICLITGKMIRIPTIRSDFYCIIGMRLLGLSGIRYNGDIIVDHLRNHIGFQRINNQNGECIAACFYSFRCFRRLIVRKFIRIYSSCIKAFIYRLSHTVINLIPLVGSRLLLIIRKNLLYYGILRPAGKGCSITGHIHRLGSISILPKVLQNLGNRTCGDKRINSGISVRSLLGGCILIITIDQCPCSACTVANICIWKIISPLADTYQF